MTTLDAMVGAMIHDALDVGMLVANAVWHETDGGFGHLNPCTPGRERAHPDKVLGVALDFLDAFGREADARFDDPLESLALYLARMQLLGFRAYAKALLARELAERFPNLQSTSKILDGFIVGRRTKTTVVAACCHLPVHECTHGKPIALDLGTPEQPIIGRTGVDTVKIDAGTSYYIHRASESKTDEWIAAVRIVAKRRKAAAEQPQAVAA